MAISVKAICLVWCTILQRAQGDSPWQDRQRRKTRLAACETPKKTVKFFWLKNYVKKKKKKTGHRSKEWAALSGEGDVRSDTRQGPCRWRAIERSFLKSQSSCFSRRARQCWDDGSHWCVVCPRAGPASGCLAYVERKARFLSHMSGRGLKKQ